MSPDFLQQCSDYRDQGYRFLGLQTDCRTVTYLFESHGETTSLSQQAEDGAVPSIAMLFPLADFPERLMYHDCKIKALGNINLIPREAL